MKTKTKFHPFGLRVVKTAISVTLSAALVRQFATDSLSVFYAAFGALIAMDTTFSKSLMQTRSFPAPTFHSITKPNL